MMTRMDDFKLRSGSISVALAAGVLQLGLSLVGQAAAQTFSADAALAGDLSGEAGFAPNAVNLAAAEVSGRDVLVRQELTAVTSLPRTCPCATSSSDDLVRQHRPGVSALAHSDLQTMCVS